MSRIINSKTYRHDGTPALRGGRPAPFSLFPALLFFFCAAAAAGTTLPYSRSTENYDISTDVSVELAGLAARHMESIYHEYRRRFPGYGRQSDVRFTVRIFRRRTDYDSSVPPAVRGSAGVFIPAESLIATFVGDRTREEVFRTLYHEGFHQFLHEYIGGHVPLWINEGFAEYFSEANWDGQRYRTGQAPWQRLQVLHAAIKSGNYIPLRNLFLVENDEWLAAVREDDTRANLQYCQAWSVVHFLVHARSGRFRNRLFDYLKAISENKGRAESFRQSFGDEIDAMERAWKSYVTALKPDNISLCRKDMELILFIGASFYGSPRRIDSMESLVQDAFMNPDTQWSVKASDGELITSTDRARLRGMLTCPERGRGARPSYILLHEPETGMPRLYCIHHPGIVIEAYLMRHADSWRTASEIIVREILPDDLAGRLRAEQRRNR